jgi:hypothetical protein
MNMKINKNMMRKSTTVSSLKPFIHTYDTPGKQVGHNRTRRCTSYKHETAINTVT